MMWFKRVKNKIPEAVYSDALQKMRAIEGQQKAAQMIDSRICNIENGQNITAVQLEDLMRRVLKL